MSRSDPDLTLSVPPSLKPMRRWLQNPLLGFWSLISGEGTNATARSRRAMT
nr:hypothetical protein OG409_01950 [Streptomyces sp. NBC_00974]